MCTAILIAISIAATLTICWLDAIFLSSPQIELRPPTTDLQFAALMPELDPTTVIKVRQILIDVSVWEAKEIHPETRLVEFEL